MDTIQTLLYKIDLVDLVQEYTPLQLINGVYRGCCPIHGGHNNTSFCILDNRYYCHSCGATGDAIKFYCEMESLSFYQAVEALADKYEVSTDDEKYQREKDMYRENAITANSFHKKVNTVTDYLVEKRGLSLETINEFQLGYDSGGFLGIDVAGIVIPIQDHYGRIVGFSKRRLDNGKPKYKNTKENEIFHKGSLLFNYHRAVKMIKHTKKLHVVEGYIDVLSAHEQGLACVGYLGGRPTQQQLKILMEIQRLYKGDVTFILAVDSPLVDEAGRNALIKTRESIMKYTPELNVRVPIYPA